jgi:hippurate hydrolase
MIATPVINDADEAIALGEAAVAVAGDANVDRNAPPVMGSEDFAYMMERVPGAHISIGNGATAGVHNHKYDFNDEAIPYGAALYAAIVEQKLPKGTAD